LRDNVLYVFLVWLESGLARMRAVEFCWTRLGELGARPKRKLSLKWRALTWARTTTTHPSLCFEDSPKRRPLA